MAGKLSGTNTQLRVIKGSVGKYDVGDTFNAEDEGADVPRLIKLGVVEFVSFAASPLPVDTSEFDDLKDQAIITMNGVGRAAEALGVSMNMDTLADAAHIEDIVLQYAKGHESLSAVEESTRARAAEIATELISARQNIARGLQLLGIPYDESVNTGQLASNLADAIDAYARKSREEVLRDVMKQEIANAQPSGETGKTGDGPPTPALDAAPAVAG